MVEKIANGVIRLYPKYKKSTDPVYNFWQNGQKKHFPNGNILSRFDYFKLPDDVDDTVMIHSTDPALKIYSTKLKQLLADHANTQKQVVQNTPKELQGLKAYTTWFGKNMPSEFDFCVMCNVLLWVKESNLPVNQYDLDTLAYLKIVISDEKYLQNPFSVSPEYGKEAILWYHFSRVVVDYPEYFQDVKEEIIRKMTKCFKKSSHLVEKILMASSLLRIGITVKPLEVPLKIVEKYYWFRAGMMSTYENPISRFLAPMPIFHLNFYCEAYIQTLALEYEILNSQITNRQNV